MQFRACIVKTNLRSYVYICVGSCISIVLAASMHLKLVDPVIDFNSFFITGGPTSARKRHFSRILSKTSF